MRKYKGFIVGLVTGVLMTASVGTYAATTSNVGKKVQGEVTVVVDGSTLPQKGIVIDGSSYAPLRSVGDSAGYDVGFKDKTVTFTKKGVPPVDTTTSVDPLQVELNSILEQIKPLEKQLKEIQDERTALDEEVFKGGVTDARMQEIKAEYITLTDRAKVVGDQIKPLWARRDELQKQLRSQAADEFAAPKIVPNG